MMSFFSNNTPRYYVREHAPARLVITAFLWLIMLTMSISLFSCIRIDNGKGDPAPGLNGGDVKEIADKMVRSMLNCDVVEKSKKPPRIAVLRFKNNSRFRIDSDIFLAKLQADANSKAPGRLVFLDRTSIDAAVNERKGRRECEFSFREGDLEKAISGADYFLSGAMRGLSRSGGDGRTEDYVLITVWLVNAENTQIVWEDQFERDFSGRVNFVYR